MNINETNETRVSVEAKMPYVAYTDINRKEFEDNTTLHGSFKVESTGNTLELSETNIVGQKKVILINSATKDRAGIMSSFDKQNLDNSSVIQIQWDYNSHINSFVTAGVYNIVGERTNYNDGLPILNTASGHSINARLEVFDSSISGTGKDTDKCITQKLTISNRVVGDGDVYIRTGRGASKEAITWETWGKLQQNIEVGEVSNLDTLTDNCIYSGVYKFGNSIYDFETFVMVVINDYAIAKENKHISQFKYALSKTGKVSYKTRVYSVKEGNSFHSWGKWSDIGVGGGIDVDTEEIINGLTSSVTQNTSDIKKLLDKNFPLTVTLNTIPLNSASDAFKKGDEQNVIISWKLKYEGNTNYEDLNKYTGTLKIGDNIAYNFNFASGSYTAPLYDTTDIILTVNGKSITKRVYFAKPMYSGCLDKNTMPTSTLDNLNKINPIATGINYLGNQDVKGLSTDYVYWILIPDSMTIANATDVNTGWMFYIEEDKNLNIPGYKAYKSDVLSAGESWCVKFNGN